jgi:site-specific recombinase XerD
MISEYLNHLEQVRGLSPCTLRAYEHDLRKFASWARHNVATPQWSAISQADVEAWVRSMTTAGAQASSVKRQVSALRSFYRFHVHQGTLTKNPAQWVCSPKQQHKLPSTMAMSDVVATVHDTSEDTETRALVALMAETGMRISEALAVSTHDVTPATRVIRVHGKGSKERVVSYGETTRQLLNAVMGTRRGMVFVNKPEREYRREVWFALGRHTTATKHSPHIIRHTWACEHLSNGTDIKTLSAMMGHVSVKTTEIYAQVAGARLLQSFNNVRI